jgi:hypothetical protein
MEKKKKKKKLIFQATLQDLFAVATGNEACSYHFLKFLGITPHNFGIHAISPPICFTVSSDLSLTRTEVLPFSPVTGE